MYLSMATLGYNHYATSKVNLNVTPKVNFKVIPKINNSMVNITVIPNVISKVNHQPCFNVNYHPYPKVNKAMPFLKVMQLTRGCLRLEGHQPHHSKVTETSTVTTPNSTHSPRSVFKHTILNDKTIILCILCQIYPHLYNVSVTTHDRHSYIFLKNMSEFRYFITAI